MMRILSFSSRLFVGAVLCIFHSQGALQDCVDENLNDITFDVLIDTQLQQINENLFYLHADVTWTVNNPRSAKMDGFAVNFIENSMQAESIEPTNTCHSGNNHLWVISSDQSVCDTSDSAPQCSQRTKVPDACLCPQPNCTLFHPTSCRSVLELLGPDHDNHSTVLPTVTHLRYPIAFGTSYKFSISPYHREFANLKPTVTVLQPVDECDENIRDDMAELGLTRCLEISWTPGNSEETMIVVSRVSGNSSEVFRQTAGTENRAEICGLEVCQNYTVTVLGRNGEDWVVLANPVVHTLKPNPTLGTTPPMTTALPTEPNLTLGTTPTTTTTLPTDFCGNPDLNGCHEYADCNSAEGSYLCSCKSGFSGNGTFCEDIDECKLQVDVCGSNSVCANTDGRYTCSCKPGFEGDGLTCSDVDECSSGVDNCHPNAKCVNTIGSFSCSCDPGFTGDGVTCEALSRNCSSTQTISGYTFPPTQPGLVSYSEERCSDVSCPDLPDDVVGICVEECNPESLDCDEGYLCCSNGCGHTCQRGVGGSGVPGAPIASIRCVLSQDSLSAEFDETTLTTTSCDETVEELASPPYDDVSRKLDELQVMTANVQSLVKNDVQQITQFLEGISEGDDQFNRKDVQNVAEIASHLSEYYGQEDQGGATSSSEKQSLLESIDAISRQLNETSSDFNVESNSINVAVRDTSTTSAELTFAPRFYNGLSAINPIQITIPSEAFERAQFQLDQGGTAPSSVRVVSIAYRSSNLFPSEQGAEWVIASSLGDKNTSLERISLNGPVRIINYEVNEQHGKQRIDDFTSNLTKLECVFWDFSQGSWSSEGCYLASTSPATCDCDHLTNFAVLVSTRQIPADFALSVVSYVGSGLSIVFLLCTVLFITLTSRLRKKHPSQIMMNLCSCLAVSLVFFIFGVGSGVEKDGCAVLTVLLHYFLLVTWFWMAIYSHTVYRDVVKVMDSYGQKYNIVYACAVGYGVPIIIVGLNAAIALGYVDVNKSDDPFLESAYVARNFCWLRGNSLYFGFLLPVGILLLYNIFVFCMVLPGITCRRNKLQSSASPKTLKQNAIVALVMATTMGLSWIVGYLMLIADYEEYLIAMSWMFAILNSFQGVFIFFFIVVRTEEMKRFFRKRFLSSNSASGGKSISTNSSGLSPRSPPRSPAIRM